MSDLYVIIATLVIFSIQLVIGEVDKRRSLAREEALIKMVKSLQNRISAKDLGSYLALEEQEKPQQPRIMQQPVEVDMFDSLPFGMNGGV